MFFQTSYNKPAFRYSFLCTLESREKLINNKFLVIGQLLKNDYFLDMDTDTVMVMEAFINNTNNF